MAVEDHPDFPRWSAALDTVVRIRDELMLIPKTASGSQLEERKRLSQELALALVELHRAGEAIDAGEDETKS